MIERTRQSLRKSSSPSRRCSVISVPRSALLMSATVYSPSPADSQKTPFRRCRPPRGTDGNFIGNNKRRIEARRTGQSAGCLSPGQSPWTQGTLWCRTWRWCRMVDDLIAIHTNAVIGDGQVRLSLSNETRTRSSPSPSLQIRLGQRAEAQLVRPHRRRWKSAHAGKFLYWNKENGSSGAEAA